MSLINEALKQAGQTGANPAPAPSPRAVGVMRPASVDAQSRSLVFYLLPVAFLLALLMAFVTFRNAWVGGETIPQSAPVSQAAKPANASEDWFRPPAASQAEKSAPSIAAPPANAAPAMTIPTPVESKATAGVASGAVPASESAPAPVAATTPIPTTVASVAPVPVVPAEPPPPAFRLQGITYSASAPSALVNGKAVFVGDEVDGALVTRIDQRSVTLAVDGRQQVLRMR